jgi:hypothetical protein
MMSKRVKVAIVAIAVIIGLASLSFWALSGPSSAHTEAEKIIIISSDLNESGNWHHAGLVLVPYPYRNYLNQSSNATSGMNNGTLEVGVVISVFNSTSDCFTAYEAVRSNLISYSPSLENVTVGEAGVSDISNDHFIEIYFVRGNVFCDIWVDSGHSGTSVANLTGWALSIAGIQDWKIQSFQSGN